jgi:ketosteroid isomerase-like protein
MPNHFLLSCFIFICIFNSQSLFAQFDTSTPLAIRSYEKVWAEPDSTTRLQQIKTFWLSKSTYHDGAAFAKGPIELNNMIQKFRKKFPNSILIGNPVLSFGNYHTWSWTIINKEKNFYLDGRDYVEINANGKITKLVGFWGLDRNATKELNISLVKTYYESLFKKQDFSTIQKILSDDFVYYQAEGLPYGGIYKGFEELMKMFGKASTYFDLQIEKEPEYFINESSNKVDIYFVIKCKSKKSGDLLTMPISEHFELKDGKISSIRPFYYDTNTFSTFCK